MAIKIFIKTNDDSSFLFKNEANPGFVAKPKTYELELVPTQIRKHKADETKEYTVRCINLYTKNVLFEAVKVSEIDVNGTVYPDYATLSAALAGLVFKKGGGGGSGASQIQSDWNQANPSALDFVKNKPDLSLKADLVGGKVPSAQLPSYVDDVLEFSNLASFPVTGESGKIYMAIDTGFTYRWSGSAYTLIHSPELDTLENVVNRGNSTTLPIIFNPDEDRNGELNFNKNSYSYYFGNHSNSNSAYYNNAIGYNCLNNVTTGISNNGYGSFTMELLTTGEYNASFGGNSLTNLVSGRRNSAFGNATGLKLTTGSHNTMCGIGALPKATISNSNIALGDNSLPDVITKGNNIGIGKDTGAEGEAAHCVYIGSRAGTGNTTDGVLAIHNWRLNSPNTGAWSYAETVAQMNVVNSLIYGNFITKFLTINGAFNLNPSLTRNAQGDSTYTKQLVAKPNGNIGWEDKTVQTQIKEFFDDFSGISLTLLNTPKSNTIINVIEEGLVLREGLNRDYVVSGNIITLTTPRTYADIEINYTY